MKVDDRFEEVYNIASEISGFKYLFLFFFFIVDLLCFEMFMQMRKRVKLKRDVYANEKTSQTQKPQSLLLASNRSHSIGLVLTLNNKLILQGPPLLWTEANID